MRLRPMDQLFGMKISTWRFFALFSGEVFGNRGYVSPNPCGLKKG